MRKQGLNKIHKLFQRKSSYKKWRSGNWTKTYPSPEPSLLKKTFAKSCDWIYRQIDLFFQGPAIKQQNYCNSLNSNELANTTYTMIWVMNQDVTDIALKDIKYSLGWVVPGLVRRSLYRLYWKIAIYFIADVIIEEEIFKPEYVESIHNIYKNDNQKTITSIEALKQTINIKLLTINDWLIEFWRRLKLFFSIRHQADKTFYLLGNFVPHEYGYLSDDCVNKIREYDNCKLSSAFAYYKRN